MGRMRQKEKAEAHSLLTLLLSTEPHVVPEAFRGPQETPLWGQGPLVCAPHPLGPGG